METKIILDNLSFATKHKSIYTGCIHFKNKKEPTRDVIPLVENILYGIALVTTLSKEKAEKGFAFLERMFAFCTDNGFPGYIHDFPHVYNDRTNVDICLALSFFLKGYSKVIPVIHRTNIEAVKEKLITILKQRPLKPLDKYVFDTALFSNQRQDVEIDSVEVYEKVVLCKLLMKEKVTLPWHRYLNVYTGPLVDTFYEGHLPQETLFSLLTKGSSDDKISLFGALLPKDGWQGLIEFEPQEREDLFINHQKDMLSIHFDNHSIVAKGEMDINIQGNHIDIILDDFEEFSIYFSDRTNSQITVEGAKATAFYPENTVTLSTDNIELTMSFISKCNYFGHIMKGNRYNQILDCNKNFSLFDHKILLKKTN